MKNYIVRAPETDRLKLPIPVKLADLTDYPATIAHGIGTMPSKGAASNQLIAYGTPATVALNTFTELVNAAQSTNGIVVSVGGLYLVTGYVYWAKYSVGVSIFQPPASNLRTSVIVKNGTILVSALTNTAVQNAPDSGSTVLRLAAGDIITLYATNLDSTSMGNIDSAVLTVTKLSP